MEDPTKSRYQIFQYRIPIRKLLRSVTDQLAFKLRSTVLVAVIYEVVSLAQMLAVRDDHLLVEYIIQMFGDPCDLVAPR